VLIAGNHEHYSAYSRSGASFGATLAALRAEAARSAGQVVFLECETAIIAGVRFVACTLWTDFRLYRNGRDAMAYAETGMTDFRVIANREGKRFTPSNARDEFAAARRFLERSVQISMRR